MITLRCQFHFLQLIASNYGEIFRVYKACKMHNLSTKFLPCLNENMNTVRIIIMSILAIKPRGKRLIKISLKSVRTITNLLSSCEFGWVRVTTGGSLWFQMISTYIWQSFIFSNSFKLILNNKTHKTDNQSFPPWIKQIIGKNFVLRLCILQALYTLKISP